MNPIAPRPRSANRANIFLLGVIALLAAMLIVTLLSSGTNGIGSVRPTPSEAAGIAALPMRSPAATRDLSRSVTPGSPGRAVPTPSPARAEGPPEPVPGDATEATIRDYTDRLKANPNDHDTLLLLGLAYYQHARETADPTDYGRAGKAFDRLIAADPSDVDALIGEGTIALARHDFAGALAIGQKALALNSHIARIYGVIGDAQVELGNYDAAVESVQLMVNTRPDLSSYSRVSYQRELHGQIDGAIAGMESAVEAGGPATENTEYVRVILGNLWFLQGNLQKAESSYEASLAHSPGYVYALAGMARVKAAEGDLAGAIDLYTQASDRVPFPEFLVALGEAQEAAGRSEESARTYRLVRQIEGLFTANGVNTDLDLALFEAEHGDAATSLELARAAYAATPNIKAADALAWALYKNGYLPEARQRAEEALRLGTLDPAWLYHAGMIAKAQGDDAWARRWLGQSLAANPGWSPLLAPRARAALADLGSGPVAGASPMETAAP
jgi:tetratricopeptide (TPR) repeat protein